MRLKKLAVGFLATGIIFMKVGGIVIDAKHNFFIGAELVSEEKLIHRNIGKTYYRKKYVHDPETFTEAIDRGGFKQWGVDEKPLSNLVAAIGPRNDDFFGTRHLNGPLANVYFRAISKDRFGRQFLACDEDFIYLFSVHRHMIF